MMRPCALVRLFIAALFASLATLGAAGQSADDLSWSVPPPLADLGRGHKVRLIYFVPADREATPEHEGKIRAVMALVNDVLRRDLARRGIESRGLDFEFAEGQAVVHLVRGQRPADHYNGGETYDRHVQWRTVNEEVEARFGPPQRRIHLIFPETHGDGPAAFEWPGSHAHAAWLSADAGVGIMTAWILRDELCRATIDEEMRFLFDEAPIAGRVAHGHGQPDSPRFEFIEDGVGAIVHELGHALGLMHDTRDPADVMGHGFRDLRQAFAHDAPPERRPTFSEENARFLALSRFLREDWADVAAAEDGSADPAGTAKNDAPASETPDNEAPQFSLTLPGLTPGQDKIALVIEATDNTDLAAAVYRDLKADSVIGGAELVGTSSRLDVVWNRPPLVADEEIEIEVRMIDRAGNISWATLKKQVSTAAEVEDDSVDGATQLDGVKLWRDIPYRDGHSPSWRLDLAVPDPRPTEDCPAIVVIHGGGWIEGDKSSFSTPEHPVPGNIIDFARLGFVAASINYRLSDEAVFPAALDDCRCAIRWLRAHAPRYGIDRRRIGAYGNSAGGHLALLLGLMSAADAPPEDGFWSEEAGDVQAAASDSGPLDMLAQHQQGTLAKVVEKFLGGPPEGERRNLYLRASPSQYVRQDACPMLLIYGGRDNQVPIATADDLVRALEQAGHADVTYLRLADADHCPHSLVRVGWLLPAVNEFFSRALAPR
jgi:acetyl esterase/lipase